MMPNDEGRPEMVAVLERDTAHARWPRPGCAQGSASAWRRFATGSSR
jgi:hypothetical protein